MKRNNEMLVEQHAKTMDLVSFIKFNMVKQDKIIPLRLGSLNLKVLLIKGDYTIIPTESSYFLIGAKPKHINHIYSNFIFGGNIIRKYIIDFDKMSGYSSMFTHDVKDINLEIMNEEKQVFEMINNLKVKEFTTLDMTDSEIDYLFENILTKNTISI